MKTKCIKTILASAVMIGICFPAPVKAEDPDYSDTEYWNARCTGQSAFDAADRQACNGYIQYLSDQNTETSKKIKDIEANAAAIEQSIENAQTEYESLQAQITEKQAQIDEKQSKIDATQVKIEEKQSEIDAKQAEVDRTQTTIDAVKEKLKKRMAAQQADMRVSRLVDILMGAKSFEDLIRVTMGLDMISQQDKKTQQQLVDLLAELNNQKTVLEQAKTELIAVQDELKSQKEELSNAQQDLIADQYQQSLLIDAYQKQQAELQAEKANYAANIEATQEKMREIAATGNIDVIPTASGWTFPVPGSHKSAGTWYYPGGGVHLGYDFAATIGTPILAPAPGVVLNSANGCGYGSLGNWCGSAQGGVAGGGNQVTLLVKVNGSLYAVTMAHMNLNSPIAMGTVVNAGDQVGAVGSSGNSTGPHCHVEVFYLGSSDLFSSYATSWNGDFSFGCGWGSSALYRTCENGVGAPCRMRPEAFFGG